MIQGSVRASGKEERKATKSRPRSTFLPGQLRCLLLLNIWFWILKTNLPSAGGFTVYGSTHSYPLTCSENSQQANNLSAKASPIAFERYSFTPRLMNLCMTPLFYIMAAEKERLVSALASLHSLFCRHTSNSVSPANPTLPWAKLMSLQMTMQTIDKLLNTDILDKKTVSTIKTLIRAVSQFLRCLCPRHFLVSMFSMCSVCFMGVFLPKLHCGGTPPSVMIWLRCFLFVFSCLFASYVCRDGIMVQQFNCCINCSLLLLLQSSLQKHPPTQSAWHQRHWIQMSAIGF